MFKAVGVPANFEFNKFELVVSREQQHIWFYVHSDSLPASCCTYRNFSVKIMEISPITA